MNQPLNGIHLSSIVQLAESATLLPNLTRRAGYHLQRLAESGVLPRDDRRTDSIPLPGKPT